MPVATGDVEALPKGRDEAGRESVGQASWRAADDTDGSEVGGRVDGRKQRPGPVEGRREVERGRVGRARGGRDDRRLVCRKEGRGEKVSPEQGGEPGSGGSIDVNRTSRVRAFRLCAIV